MPPTPLKYPTLKPGGCVGIVSPSWFGGETAENRAVDINALFADPYELPEEHWHILERLFRARFRKYDFPVITNMNFGHHSPMIAMPLGVRARVDTEMGSVTLLESPAQ